MHREDPEGNETLGEQAQWEFWLTSDQGYFDWIESLEEKQRARSASIKD